MPATSFAWFFVNRSTPTANNRLQQYTTLLNFLQSAGLSSYQNVAGMARSYKLWQ